MISIYFHDLKKINIKKSEDHLGTDNFPLGDMYLKDKGSEKGCQQSEAGRRKFALFVAYILKN